MIISFYSNYLTHHQIPFCQAMSKIEGVEFHFISTEQMEEDRMKGGWAFDSKYNFELKAYINENNHQKALELAQNSDVIIVGSAPEEYVKHRMKYATKKITLRYSERIYKRGRWRVISPRGVIVRYKTYFRYLGKPLFMLCASAYTAGDFALLASYLGKCFKWGYFPETKKYLNFDNMQNSKEQDSILWVARMIELKHPEIAIRLAKCLKNKGYNFTLHMIGEGPLTEPIREMIEKEGLSDCVFLLGTMKPEEVREQMEKHQIFLFTSNSLEGWGAVLNEAMNSGCAIVANDQIGSAPFLINHGVNGFTYHKGSERELYEMVEILLNNSDKAREMGKAAYTTMTEEWSVEAAADKLYFVCKNLLQGKKIYEKSGPCSKANIFLKKRSK